jgi:hypothetical protein
MPGKRYSPHRVARDMKPKEDRILLGCTNGRTINIHQAFRVGLFAYEKVICRVPAIAVTNSDNRFGGVLISALA